MPRDLSGNLTDVVKCLTCQCIWRADQIADAISHTEPAVERRKVDHFSDLSFAQCANLRHFAHIEAISSEHVEHSTLKPDLPMDESPSTESADEPNRIQHRQMKSRAHLDVSFAGRQPQPG